MTFLAVVLGSAVGTSVGLLVRLAWRLYRWRLHDRDLPEPLRRG